MLVRTRAAAWQFARERLAQGVAEAIGVGISKRLSIRLNIVAKTTHSATNATTKTAWHVAHSTPTKWMNR